MPRTSGSSTRRGAGPRRKRIAERTVAARGRLRTFRRHDDRQRLRARRRLSQVPLRRTHLRGRLRRRCRRSCTRPWTPRRGGRSFWDDRIELWSDFRYRDYPQEDYFGPGDDSNLTEPHSYAIESTDIIGRALLKVTPWLRHRHRPRLLQPDDRSRHGRQSPVDRGSVRRPRGTGTRRAATAELPAQHAVCGGRLPRPPWQPDARRLLPGGVRHVGRRHARAVRSPPLRRRGVAVLSAGAEARHRACASA